jgi:hypothetical protein
MSLRPITTKDAARIEGVMMGVEACLLSATELMAEHYPIDDLRYAPEHCNASYSSREPATTIGQ